MWKGSGDIGQEVHGPGGLSVSLFPPPCSLARRWRLVRNWPWLCHGASSLTPRGAAGTRCSAPAATAPRRPPHAAPRTPFPPKVRGSRGVHLGFLSRCQVRKRGGPPCWQGRKSSRLFSHSGSPGQQTAPGPSSSSWNALES